MRIGEQLKEARERRKLSIAEAEVATKIRAKYLRALEEENYQDLPARVYAIGFLKNYAKYLGLEPNDLVEEFKYSTSYLSQEDVPELVVKDEPAASPVNPRKWRSIIIACVAVAVLAVPIYWLTRGASETPIQPPKGAVNPSPPGTAAANPNPAVTPPQNPPAANQGITMELVTYERTWVRVIVDGVTSYTGTLVPGERKKFTGSKQINMRIGNAGGVELIKNGVSLGFPGKSGQPVDQEFKLENEHM